MLKLERMEISGFKSFSDRTEIVFPTGITAVVGPNGCGKSNLGDAINWVLGEQSPKQLRGRQMADVIFNGSRARKPLGMAEVSLHLGGGEGLAWAEQGKVVVTRRLFRSGESDYLLNGAKARLRDIQELLREARIGTKTYATIEQGRIDQVLNAKPRDRRMIIEDAAGVAGYKHKRRLTELKLEATQANLLRVNDIVVEVRRQINSLKRQAAKARRYRRLREELRDRELLRFALRTRQLDAELETARACEAEDKDRESAVAAELSRFEVDLLGSRESLEQQSGTFRETADRLHQLEIAAQRDEAQIKSCRERIVESEQARARYQEEADRVEDRLRGLGEARTRQADEVQQGRAAVQQLEAVLEEQQRELELGQARQQQLREELETLRKQQFEAIHRAAELRNRRRSDEELLERAARQREALESEQQAARSELAAARERAADLERGLAEQVARLERLRGEVEAGEAVLADGRTRLLAAQEQLGRAREQQQSAQSRLHTLEDVATRFAGVSDGVRTLLGAASEAGIQATGVIADFIEARPDVESAAEGYLDQLLPTVIVDSDEAVHRAAELLRSAGAGRTSIVCKNQPAGALAIGIAPNGSGGVPPELFDDRRVLGRLSDRLRLETSANGVLRDRIGDALLVDSLPTALELHRRHPGADYLTERGDVVYASGIVAVGGKDRGDRGLLAHNRRMHETAEELARTQASCNELQSELAARQVELADNESGLRDRRAELDQVSHRRIELGHRAEQSLEDRERLDRRVRVLDAELANLDAETDRLREALAGRAGELEVVERDERGVAEGLEGGGVRIQEAEKALAERAERVAEVRAELAAERQRQEGREREQARLDETLQELDARLVSLREAVTGETSRAESAAQLLASTEASLVGHLQERESLAKRAEQLEREIAEARQQLTGREKDLRERRDALEGCRGRARDAEIARARAESSRQNLDELCQQELGLGASEAVVLAAEAVEEGKLPPDGDCDALEQEVVELKQKLDAIGPVNMTAIEEFAELEERHTFLTRQHEDLDKSMTSLRETIRRINRQSRELFLQAFEAIRASYQEIFKLLFNGGHADLRLEEGEDVLECGIEIMAQPPGKRLASVQLLSGGEKAMSAIALLFAVFRYQPSPFCLLDEVDAALDDHNVGRFARMVREYAGQTQFILVTHNKLSMEAADLLYGVTMEEPGVSKLVSIRLQ